jgi:nicotinamide phosphoribosyltransferase
MTIENTDPNVPWLTNYLETILMQVWYPTTVCTQSRAMKQDISEAMRLSGADMAGLPFKLHDFGYRGSTSFESAGIGGCAHLVNFMGTDTMAALQVARNYYNEPMAGFSIPAAEHSTMTAWGKTNEAEAYRNMLEQFPKGLVAVVSDSYDIYHACSEIWGDELKDQVLNRDGVVIIRPDSGDPVKVILSLLSILGDKFGVSTTSTGDRVLNPKVRLIQGDGIDREMLTHILDAMLDEKWSIDNIAFGSGGGLLQKVNRDTCKFALKCSAIEVNGKWLDVMKDPITDSGKRSKAGRLILVKDKGGYRTVQEGSSGSNLLEEVFRNGQHILPPTLSGIRERASR